jgi:TatD DNase family protein
MTDRLRYVDTHAHLIDPQFESDAGNVIERSALLGVTRIVNVAFTQRLWGNAITLSERHSGVAYTLGIHPNTAEEWNDQTRDALIARVEQRRPVAIGETGLDYYWDLAARDSQIRAFGDQMGIASDYGLPVVIHMRGEVESDIRSILEGRSGVMCVFHSFDGSQELCQWVLERGWILGAGGLMSRRSAKTLRSCLTTAPLEQLLLETDSPYLAPTGWHEKRNTPESIPIIAEHLARLLGRPVEEIARATTGNACRVFGLDCPEDPPDPEGRMYKAGDI